MKIDPAGMQALITGGGTGIGRSIALALARRGAAVIVTGRRLEPLESVVAEINALGGQASYFQADLTDAAALAQLAECAGSVELIICNAGELLVGEFVALQPADIERLVRLNLSAPLELVRRLLPSLRALVLVSSQAGQIPLPYCALYSATKAGLSAFGAALRYELDEVQVIIAEPPATRTAMTERFAAASGFKAFCSAEFVGEQIVKALCAGHAHVRFRWFDALPLLAQHWFPGLVWRILRWQRKRFAPPFFL